MVDKAYWIRMLPAAFTTMPRSDGALSILVPIQTWHITALGKASQSELSGPGDHDVRLTPPESDDAFWSFEVAEEFCRNELAKFKDQGLESASASLKRLVYTEIERQDGAFLGRTIQAKSGLAAQEIVVPQETLNDLIDRAEIESFSFFLLWQLGLICIENRHLEVQPSAFQVWVSECLSGQKKPPGKRQKAWGNFARDQLISGLVWQVSRRGFREFRNPEQKELRRQSACDAVALAARKTRLRGVSSYDTVQKIHSRAKAATAKALSSIEK